MEKNKRIILKTNENKNTEMKLIWEKKKKKKLWTVTYVL